MENPVDHTIDLGLVNYVQHPSNPQYIVYRFADKNRADSFKTELVNQKIWFEENTEPKRSKEYTLFGIHKGDFKKTESINYRVEAKHKKPFIPFKMTSAVFSNVLQMILFGFSYLFYLILRIVS